MSDRQHARSTAIDATDVLPVPASVMAIAIGAMVGSGHGLALVQGASDDARSAIEAAFWKSHDGDRLTGHAALIRFWHLADVMMTRRLSAMFYEHGYAAFAPLGKVAARARLNVTWGFRPQTFVAALAAEEAPAAIPAERFRLAA